MDEQFLYIAADNPAAASRFLDAVRSTLEQLSQTPDLGTLWGFEHPRLKDVRVWPVRGFRNCLVFYRPVPDGLEVLRLLHGARDMDGIFETNAD